MINNLKVEDPNFVIKRQEIESVISRYELDSSMWGGAIEPSTLQTLSDQIKQYEDLNNEQDL